MRLLGRLVFLIPLALLFAIAAGVLALAAAAALDPVLGAFAAEVVGTGLLSFLDRLASVDEPELVVQGAFSGMSRLAATLVVMPPAFVALVGEVAGLRSLAWYACATGAVTAAIPWLIRTAERPASLEELHVTLALVATGALAGLVYWLIAGSSAGRQRPFTVPAAPGS